MKNVLKLSLVVLGFGLAVFASSNSVEARKQLEPVGGCVGQGDCGVTAGGTILYGKWQE